MEDGRDDAEMLKLTMKTLKQYYGLNPGKHRNAVRDAGSKLGAAFTGKFEDGDLDAVVGQLIAYWSKYGIGEMSWSDRNASLLTIGNCSDCIGRSYGAGYTLCPFKEGFIENVVAEKTKQATAVTEVECCGLQSEGCKFKVEQKG